jgi:hypothetical protein
VVVVTLWSGSGLRAAWAKGRAHLEMVRPHVVQLHGAPSLLKEQAPAIADQVRAALPGVRIWLGVAGDAGHTDVRAGKLSVDELHRRRVAVAETLRACGADRPLLNCEENWKRGIRPPQGGFDDAAATRWVRDLQAALPGVPIEHSAYAAVAGHTAYAWGGFLGPGLCARSWWQLYEIHSVKGAIAALDRHRKSVAAERLHGLIGPQCVAAPYLQAHHGTKRDRESGAMVPYGTHPLAASVMADAFNDVTFWAAGERMDDDGAALARALVEIERRGFTGAGRIARFQASAGLNPDSQIGPKTRAALGLP